MTKKYIDDNERILKNRFIELSRRAEEHYICTNTDFLSIAEQNILLSLDILSYELTGGYPKAERRLAIFGANEQSDYNVPIDCISISPVSKKFSDQLTHRDILGAVMSLGIERKSTGDIVIVDNIGYLFCLNKISQYILDNLSCIKHTTVKCAILSQLPTSLFIPTTSKNINVASERLDCVIASVFNLSRSYTKELIYSQRVYINSRQVGNAGMIIPNGSVITLRGYGRFIYNGIIRTTKKERLCVSISVY